MAQNNETAHTPEDRRKAAVTHAASSVLGGQRARSLLDDYLDVVRSEPRLTPAMRYRLQTPMRGRE